MADQRVQVYVLSHDSPDYHSDAAPAASVHLTLEGAKAAFSEGKYMDSWRQERDGRWGGPDGFGLITRMDLQR